MKHIAWSLAWIAVALAVCSGLPAFAATLTVTNLNDSGPGSLRAEIAGANPGDTIIFQPGLTGTITLTSAGLTISQDLTINGPSASMIAVSGNNSFTVFTINAGTVLISNLTIENGQPGASGGGIVNMAAAILSVINSTISNNTADNKGGGIFNGGILSVINSTFSGNTATAAGGAIFDFGTLTVTNSTISGNTAPTGGGIFELAIGGRAPKLKSTILANNGAGGNCSGGLNSAGYNLSDDASCAFGATGDRNNTPAGLDPAGLKNNGGPTPTIALLPTSIAVDAIPVAACTDQSVPPVPVLTDQRYVSRPQGLACDIGAYELQRADSFQVRYATNLTTLGDSFVNLSNTGATASASGGGINFSGGTICANIYVFDPNEEELDCCSCQITPNALQSMSVQGLISNNLTPEHPGSVVIKLLATGVPGGTCNPASAGTPANPLVPGLRAWGTTLHQTGGSPNITYGTETEFAQAGSTLSNGELNRLTNLCSVIISNGSGSGLCKGCSMGGL